MSPVAVHRRRSRPLGRSRRERFLTRERELVRAINGGDDAAVESAILELSHSRRIFAPLVLAIGAFVMLFQGVKLLFANWRLTLVQVLPAMWIWVALLDLKLHVFRGREFPALHGSVQAALVIAITLVTAAAFYLNAAFAFAVSQPRTPRIQPAFALVRRHLGPVLGVGFAVGLALGVAAVAVPRWWPSWFGISMSVVVGVMMFTYVTVPARIVGVKPAGSRRDKLATTMIGGALGALVCTPPYVIGRVGILLLGSNVLFALGVVLLIVGFTLQAGATGAVKAVKMSAKFAAGNVAPTAGPAASAGSSGPRPTRP